MMKLIDEQERPRALRFQPLPGRSASPTRAGPRTASPPTSTPTRTPTTGRAATASRWSTTASSRTTRRCWWTYLEEQGHEFRSETDTEVLAHLIIATSTTATRGGRPAALREVTGTYGIAVICADEPDVLVAARKGSPLIIGVGKDEYIVASDAPPSSPTRPGDLPRRQQSPAHAATASAPPPRQRSRHAKVERSSGRSRRSNWRLRALHAQGDLRAARAAPNCLRGRIDLRDGAVVLGGLRVRPRPRARQAHHLDGGGHGVARRLIGEYLFEDLAKHPDRGRVRQRVPLPQPDHRRRHGGHRHQPVGETADTLAALREAKQRGALCAGRGQRRRLDHRARDRRGRLPARRAGDRRRVDQGVHRPGAVLTLMALFMGRRGSCPRTRARSTSTNSSRCPSRSSRCSSQRGDPRRTAGTSTARTGSSSAAATTTRSRWRARSSSRKSATSTPRACPPRR
jgi:hypothetical protein